jgi:tryptophan halogenase
MIHRVRKIIVFGGGTSGWLTAAYLVKNLNIPTEVVLIEDSSAGPLGVGEGTQPFTAQFIYDCGITPEMWMKDSDASFKLGVELVGWNQDPYFVDNDSSDNCVVAENLYTPEYFANKPYEEFSKWHPAYNLAKANKSLKIKDHLDLNFQMGPQGYGAVHFNAYKIIDTVKKLIIDKITYVDTKIENIGKDIHGITKLVGNDGVEYKADLYLDCTGFQSLLIGKTLETPFQSYSEWLPNDRAVVIPTQYTDPQQECFPYTRATAMNSGWMFTIPNFTRIGNGYVYSSKFISDEDAEKELREKIGEFEASARLIKMRCGFQKAIAVKNACAIGLSAGFVEPLEATGITFTTSVVKSVTDLLNMYNNLWNEEVKTHLNRGFYEMSVEILTFVWAHYHFSTKNDTPYWQHIRSIKITDLPKESQYVLGHYYPNPPKFLFFSPASMFNCVQWFSMIHAGGAYKDVAYDIDPKVNQYYEYFLDTLSYKTKKAKELFPNHYDYLKEWYS